MTGLEIDTNHFKGAITAVMVQSVAEIGAGAGNCPESCTVEGLLLTNFGGMNHTVGGEVAVPHSRTVAPLSIVASLMTADTS